MKKSRIFMAGGALLLAISAVFATKANKKFAATLTSAIAFSNDNYNYAIKASGAIFTGSAAVAGGYFNADMQLVTSAGTTIVDLGPLYTAVAHKEFAFIYKGL